MELAARATMVSGGMEEAAARPWVEVAAAGPMMMSEDHPGQMGDERITLGIGESDVWELLGPGYNN